AGAPGDFESLLCVSSRNRGRTVRIRLSRSNLDADDQGNAARDPYAARLGHLSPPGGRGYPKVRGARLDADRADPHARESALLFARQDPPTGMPPDEAVAAVDDVLESIGDICP